jgi:hypothetical protein
MKMKIRRREFLKSLAVSGGFVTTIPRAAKRLNRVDLVHRHNPILRKLDPSSPLSLGNGEFAFTADITGLQTFPQHYSAAMPLCTLSQWGWHTAPLPPGLDLKNFRLTPYETHGRSVGYATRAEGQNDLYNWLRENPHRLHLGAIGLKVSLAGGGEMQMQDLTSMEQKLDLWSGILTSSFMIEGKSVLIRSSVHPQYDLLAVMIESPLILEGRLAIRFGFPYGASAMQAADWQQPARHRTHLISQKPGGARLRRVVDADEYFVSLDWHTPASFSSGAEHQFVLSPSRQDPRLEFVAAFSPRPFGASLPDARAAFSEAGKHWARFWNEGGAIELMESRDPRASELERRIVLSQYQTAIQCAGSMPPQETGLTVNSWYGKFHLEMHWWHAAHFALWNRTHLLEKSLAWYQSILPAARRTAQAQGYAGARWPKMVGPEGRDSPSPIGPLLIWQQPHPIFYAELCYRAHGNRRTLELYGPLVFESAAFMASFAFPDPNTKRYLLGPPVIPAQENHPAAETWNPTFELGYWRFGLRLAQRWRERLGMKRDPAWDDVMARLSALPTRDGVYLAHENCPQTFTERNYDHPSMLGTLGMLPGEEADRETMRRTLIKVMKEWQWDRTWGWDFPLTAMTAARLGEPKLAVDALLMPAAKNRYLPNGHNWQRESLPCYLPGNGGLLYAVAMMAAGWQGAPQRHAPGFPSDGSWTVRWENMAPAL